MNCFSFKKYSQKVLPELPKSSQNVSKVPPGAPRPGAPGPGEAPGASRRRPREASWGAHLDKKFPENWAWALLEVTKVLFWAPEALQERSGSDFLESWNMCLRALRFQLVFRAVEGSNSESWEAPGTLRIKVFVWTVCDFRDVRILQQQSPKGAPK